MKRVREEMQVDVTNDDEKTRKLERMS